MPKTCGECERDTERGRVRSTRAPDGSRTPCRSACCQAKHRHDEECDECPFIAAGEPGNVLLRLFYAAVSRWADPKTKADKWGLDRQGIVMACDIYGIDDKARAFELLSRACAIMNNEAGPPMGELEELEGDE